MAEEFISYAHRDLSRKKIIKYARQYEGVDMAKRMGADEDNFPFLVQSADDRVEVVFWNTYCGMMVNMNDDMVSEFALVKYLRENGYQVFGSIEEAERFAQEGHWPRKS